MKEFITRAMRLDRESRADTQLAIRLSKGNGEWLDIFCGGHCVAAGKVLRSWVGVCGKVGWVFSFCINILILQREFVMTFPHTYTPYYVPCYSSCSVLPDGPVGGQRMVSVNGIKQSQVHHSYVTQFPF